jgi:hypothetical protein
LLDSKLIVGLSAMLLLLVPGTLSTPAYACEVGEPGPPTQERIDQSAAIFSGTVSEIRALAIEHAPDQNVVFFKVEKYWKIPDGHDYYDKLVVFTPPNQGSCGYEFEENKTYLVYTTEHGLHVNALYTALGYGNKPIENANEDLDVLDEGNTPTTQLGRDEQMDGIVIQTLPIDQTENTINQLLLIVGSGGAAAAVVVFFSLRRLKENK